MKKPVLALFSSLLLVGLASCGATNSSVASSNGTSAGTSSTAATSAATTSEGTVSTTSEGTSSVATSEETSATSEGTTSAATSEGTSSVATSEATSAATSVNQGPLNITAIDGIQLPTYTYNAGVYTFAVSDTVKTGATLSGTLAGSIAITADSSFTDNASMELDLNGVTITSSSASPIYYESSNSKVIVKANKGTTNTISYTGTSSKAAVIQSSNNIEIAGKGSLILDGGSASHGIKCDKLELTSATALTINNAGNDGVHAKIFDASAYTGTFAMGKIASQAFDVNDYDTKALTASGAITFPTAGQSSKIAFTVESCANVFQIDNAFTITDSTSLIVGTCTETAYVENVTANTLTITNNGTYTIAGVDQGTSISVAPTTLA